MKLLTLNNRYNLISILLFLTFAGVILFMLIQYHLKQELDEELNTEKIHVIHTLQSMDSIADPSLIISDNIIINIIKPSGLIQPVLFDTLMPDNVENEWIPFRAIRFSARSKESNYEIIIKKSEIESSDLAISISISFIVLFGLIGLMMIITNYYFSKKLWSPFFTTISTINKLNMNDQHASFKVNETGIHEFRQLNSAIEKMINRIRNDFERIKEFTENAAHEIHTPLSVISSKLESMLQNRELDEENARLINQALENTLRLSKLNQSLLLLTKIENRQFEERRPVEFSEIIRKHIENYEEMFLEKQLKVEFNQSEEFITEIHPALAEILVSNLLNNAVHHNIKNGSIKIDVDKTCFQVSNTGHDPGLPADLLFARFKKGSASAEHLGLGLAIVKEIVETNRLSVSYEFENDYHKISISAKEN